MEPDYFQITEPTGDIFMLLPTKFFAKLDQLKRRFQLRDLKIEAVYEGGSRREILEGADEVKLGIKKPREYTLDEYIAKKVDERLRAVGLLNRRNERCEATGVAGRRINGRRKNAIMDKDEVARVIEQVRSAGLDPANVLRWRMDFEERPRKHVARPKGMLSMSDAKKKYDLTQEVLMSLRRNGMPTRKKSNLVLVEEATLKEWLAKSTLPRYEG